MLAHGHVADVALVDLEHHAVVLQRRDLEQHVAALDRRAELLGQVAAYDNAVERRGDRRARELLVDDGSSASACSTWEPITRMSARS